MILVEEGTGQRLQEEKEDVAHLLGAVFGDKWDATLLDASFVWLNKCGGGGGEWVIRWVGISGKMP